MRAILKAMIDCIKLRRLNNHWLHKNAYCLNQAHTVILDTVDILLPYFSKGYFFITLRTRQTLMILCLIFALKARPHYVFFVDRGNGVSSVTYLLRLIGMHHQKLLFNFHIRKFNMPSFMNETHTSSINTNANTSLSHGAPINTNMSNGGWYDPASNLGYGIGRLLRGAFDQAWDVWQNWWTPAPSQNDIALQRQAMIYKQGLEECVKHLDRAIDNLCKNPNDPQSLEKIAKLAVHYQPYIIPVKEEALKNPLRRQLQALREKLQMLAPSLQEAVLKRFPVLSSENFPMSRESSQQGETEPPLLEQSNSLETVSSNKGKRAIMEQFPAIFNLTTLNGTNGFVVPGIARGEYLGSSVNTAGDINGDGIDDLVLGAPEILSTNSGTSYVIFGNREGFVPSFNLSALNGANGFTVPGVVTNGYLGLSVSTAGDINGDNVNDLVLGALAANSNLGASYVIFGSRSGFPATFNLTNLNGTNGFTIPGVAPSGNLGISVGTAGDINADGISDLVLGANGANSGWGASYVIFGSRSGFPAIFNLSALNGANGFTVPGVAAIGDLAGLGWSVGTAGDINADGISDLVLGAPNLNSDVGVSYVIFGSRGGFSASFYPGFNLNGTNGFTISGTASGNLGSSVSTAGDINGDGVDDLVLGAYGTNSNWGASYVIFGSRSGFPASFYLANLNGTNGFTIPGIAFGEELGSSVSTAGDINADGISDLVIGASALGGLGESYVIFGSRNGFPASLIFLI